MLSNSFLLLFSCSGPPRSMYDLISSLARLSWCKRSDRCVKVCWSSRSLISARRLISSSFVWALAISGSNSSMSRSAFSIDSLCFAFDFLYSSTRTRRPVFFSSWWLALSRLLCTSLSANSALLRSSRDWSFSEESLEMVSLIARDFSPIAAMSFWMSSKTRDESVCCCLDDTSSIWERRDLISPSIRTIDVMVRERDSISRFFSARSSTVVSWLSSFFKISSFWPWYFSWFCSSSGITVSVRRSQVS